MKGYSGFQVTGMIEWGQKSKPKRIPCPRLNPHKIPCRISSHKKFQKALNNITRKIETLVLHTQKNTCQNFRIQKNSKIENFTPKKSFDHPCHLKSGVSPTGPLSSVNEFRVFFYEVLVHVLWFVNIFGVF